MRLSILGVLMAGLLAACATPVEPSAQQNTAASVMRTHEFAMTSKRTGLKYILLVSEPAAASAGEAHPANYVTDGNWYFDIVTNIVRTNVDAGVMEPAIVVAIAYPDGTYEDVLKRRTYDLLHSTFRGENGMSGGGGADFAALLIEEVRPFVEQRFRIDTARTVLAGQSFGGLLATKVLLSKPNSFSHYLIGSPSMWADMPTLNAARSFTAGAGQHVYIGVGAGEPPVMRSGARLLTEALAAPSTGLTVESAELGRFEHAEMQAAWFEAGLKFLLPRQAAE